MYLADSASSAGGALLGIVFILVGTALYILPGIIGMIRHVPNSGSVWVINIFLGWTAIGWIVALAMAVRSQPPPQFVIPPGFHPPGWSVGLPATQPQPQAGLDKPQGYQ